MALIAEKFVFRGVKYVAKWVKCNKGQCGRCPHGPYWYAEIPLPGEKIVIRYIGKHLKGAVLDYYNNEFNGSTPTHA